MKLIFLLLCSLAIGQIYADEIDTSNVNFEDLIDMDDLDSGSLEDIIRIVEEKTLNKDIERENEIASALAADALDQQNELQSPVLEFDPCEKMHCGAGRICQSTGTIAKCVCIPDCPVPTDERRLVCTNKNETYPSDCAVYQQRCFCDTGAAECKNPDNVHLHIDYYGSCRETQECTKEEMEDFPRRMSEWLFKVMQELAERDVLTDHYMQMVLETETNNAQRWANAAIWKWCDLDGDTDRSVSRHELFPIRAPLVSLEHCIAPFLESCDANNDHRITLAEWGKCLGLGETALNERCDKIHRVVPQLKG